jgi:soluble lytic murein transglycosylase
LVYNESQNRCFDAAHHLERDMKSRSLRIALVGGMAALAILVVAPPDASAKSKHAGKPAPVHHVEGGALAEMFQASRRGEWSKAEAFARKAGDPLAMALAQWLYLTDDSSTPAFDELASFLDAHKGWPGRGTMTTKAEQAIPEGMRPEAIVGWFGNREPRTGDGAVRLGEAKLALGKRAEGEAILRRAWVEEDFTPDAERRTWAEHSAILTGEPTSKRVARLLWQRRSSDAARYVDNADADVRTLAKARMAIISDPQRLGNVVDGLPASLRNDPAILFEQVRTARRNGDIARAVPLALKADTTDVAQRWWPERHALAREALGLGLYQEAYRLVAEHGLSQGSDFADAEWLAGWIALRFLEKPQLAASHFETLYKNVSYPVSKARGAYWQGRAYEALGRMGDAAGYYDTAAAYPTTYYGQLAAARLEPDEARLVLPAQPAEGAHTSLAKSELARVAALAADTRSDAVLRPFFIALGEAADSAEDYAFAGRLALELGHPGFAVRIAKKAMQDNFVLTDIAYPVLSVPRAESGAPESALVLGISRQESEFDPSAESPSGARGLMQLMPATAKVVAKEEHLQFSASRLDDPGYNMRLGTAYLGNLIDRFGGSYALAIAAYNAGPTHAREWIEQYGDPRDPNVDPIDWVEKIPFSETRNYVQRVLENTQVYRSRLAHGPAPLKIAGDLARPNSPRAGENLIAYLKQKSRTQIAKAKEPEPEPVTVAKAEPVVAPPSDAPSPPPGPAASPTPRPAEAVAGAAKSMPVPTPKPVQVADAVPTATTPIIAPAPLAEAPRPKPQAKSGDKHGDKSKTAAKTKEKVKLAAKSKPKKPVREEEPEDPADAAANPPPAQVMPTSGSPFGNGQPETRSIQSTCSRMIMDANGKPRCAERQAAVE